MVNRDERVREMIDEYMKPDGHPAMAERIHQYTFGDQIDFASWEEVEEEYIGRDWTQETFDRFVQKVQQVVDGGEKRVPESYFNIIEPSSLTVDDVVEDLSRKPFDGDARGEEREGFKFTVEDNAEVVRATYIFVNEDKNLTANGEVNSLVSEGSISYRIIPAEELLIVESTYPISVQKTKKIFREHTNMSISVLGSITANYTEADEQMEEFLNSFDRGDLEAQDD